ncbi:hypothetical protein [Falsiroseomonas tokyonensis]|uniref:Lipoprotein n=1 Tax=Falsiroseomonas tokyonensis TaxID=430521 RepID=A0ABV7BQ49_9PROT|nr:hypothetical protein [Falsiroseomonas tokyonensis]MBU8536596.1 hypothetical protein [Falsiroseomonas tokyonensis]
MPILTEGTLMLRRCIHGHILGGIAGLLLAGCALDPELEPAPRAMTVPGPGQGVEAMESGVRVAAFTEAWIATPDRLAQVLTPILIRVDNRSPVPVAIRYEAFRLNGRPGGPRLPIPPYRIDRVVMERVPTPGYPLRRFEVAPYLSPYYPGFTPFGGSFSMTPGLYGTTFPAFTQVQLPTLDMMRLALPEGVVRPGGETSGFLYFPDVETQGPTTLVVSLTNAETGARLGTVNLPFVAR